jgi:ubiquinone biosynthesis protein
VAVLDYGAIGMLTPEETRHYAVLLNVLFGKIQVSEPLGELFRKAGFVARDQQVFEEVAELVLKESVRKGSSTDVLALALNKMRDLKVQIPDSFVSLARVVLTFGGLLKTYGVSI